MRDCDAVVDSAENDVKDRINEVDKRNNFIVEQLVGKETLIVKNGILSAIGQLLVPDILDEDMKASIISGLICLECKETISLVSMSLGIGIYAGSLPASTFVEVGTRYLWSGQLPGRISKT